MGIAVATYFSTQGWSESQERDTQRAVQVQYAGTFIIFITLYHLKENNQNQEDSAEKSNIPEFRASIPQSRP